MKRSWLLVVLAVTLVVRLPASTIIHCTLNGSDITGSCYSRLLFSFTDTLDWGDSVANGGLGSSVAVPGTNPHNVYDASGSSPGTPPWNAHTAQNNIWVHASLGPGYSGGNPGQLARVDNTKYACNGTVEQCLADTHWAFPSSLVPGTLTFAGHFGAVDINHPVPYTDPHGFGDHLLGSYNGRGPIDLTFDQALSGVGFDISTRTLHEVQAQIYAYDGATLLGVYGIDVTYNGVAATGPGGACATLQNDNVACNDAPFIAITGTHITRIMVVTTDSAGFFIDTLYGHLAPPPGPVVPEPLVMLLTGAGLAAIALCRRRRSARAK